MNSQCHATTVKYTNEDAANKIRSVGVNGGMLSKVSPLLRCVEWKEWVSAESCLSNT